MFRFLTLCFGTLVRLFWSRHSLLLENLALRQQLVVLKRRHPRPKLDLFDKLFCLVVRRCLLGWRQALLVVTPETVVRWDRTGFRWYWRVISKVIKPVGRRPTSKEVRDLIFQMVAENPSWGAPRIHGELLMLGLDISERTVSRWMKRTSTNPDPSKRWLTFLHNHREAIAAIDFFTVPTVTFSVLYCFFVISHHRRRILHCNVTSHPTSLWIVQLRCSGITQAVPNTNSELPVFKNRVSNLRIPLLHGSEEGCWDLRPSREPRTCRKHSALFQFPLILRTHVRAATVPDW